MSYFDCFCSNTVAASANQLFFESEENKIHTGRVFYKIQNGGKFKYSFLFSNVIDSTYADGKLSHKNIVCDNLRIHYARVGRCANIDNNKELSQMSVADKEENKKADIIVEDLKDIYFGGRKSIQTQGKEIFSSDEIELEFKPGEYLCLEISFSGKKIPCHEESLLPIFIKTQNGWEYSRSMPLAAMVGCKRKPKNKIAYLGDSITQGIGTKPNSYKHWNALISQKAGSENSYWNLGIGYGRANDAASDGIWLYKAKQNDIVFVCYGVNDIFKGHSESEIKNNLLTICQKLKENNIKVIFQTVPPFDYPPEALAKWKNINEFIKTEIKSKADLVFDCVPILEKENIPGGAKYGGHPNEEGCRLWAEALYKEAGKFLD